MKKSSLLFLSAIALITTATSCSDDNNSTPAKTTLTLKVQNDLISTPVADISVQLIDSKGKEVGTSKKTDTNGHVSFSDLASGKYYYYIVPEQTSECKTNMVFNEVGAAILFTDIDSKNGVDVTAGKTTNKIANVRGAGTVQIHNATADSYNVYVDYEGIRQLVGTLAASGTPDATDLLFEMFTGNFDVQYVKLNGEQETDNVTVDAGKTATSCQLLTLDK